MRVEPLPLLDHRVVGKERDGAAVSRGQIELGRRVAQERGQRRDDRERVPRHVAFAELRRQRRAVSRFVMGEERVGEARELAAAVVAARARLRDHLLAEEVVPQVAQRQATLARDERSVDAEPAAVGRERARDRGQELASAGADAGEEALMVHADIVGFEGAARADERGGALERVLRQLAQAEDAQPRRARERSDHDPHRIGELEERRVRREPLHPARELEDDRDRP